MANSAADAATDKPIRVYLLLKHTGLSPEDDWTGVSDQKQRRRLQNRLNQRIIRRRRKDGAISARVHANTGPAELGQIDDVHILEPDLEGTRAKLRTLERIVHERFSLGSPRTGVLLHLIQLNFTRVLMENLSILGLLAEHLHDEALSPFNTAGPWLYDISLQVCGRQRSSALSNTTPGWISCP